MRKFLPLPKALEMYDGIASTPPLTSSAPVTESKATRFILSSITVKCHKSSISASTFI